MKEEKFKGRGARNVEGIWSLLKNITSEIFLIVHRVTMGKLCKCEMPRISFYIVLFGPEHEQDILGRRLDAICWQRVRSIDSIRKVDGPREMSLKLDTCCQEWQ